MYKKIFVSMAVLGCVLFGIMYICFNSASKPLSSGNKELTDCINLKID